MWHGGRVYGGVEARARLALATTGGKAAPERKSVPGVSREPSHQKPQSAARGAARWAAPPGHGETARRLCYRRLAQTGSRTPM